MIKYIFSNEEKWMEKWDVFVKNNPKGSHLIFSDWLKSYVSYGFDYELGLVLENDKIIGGYGAIIPKFLLFKFYIIPHGPILNIGNKQYIAGILEQIRKRAKLLGCCYAQVSLPISSNYKMKDFVFSPNEVKIFDNKFKTGKLFNYIYCSYGLNWMDFSQHSNPDSYLKNLSSKVRQYVRLPYKKNTEIFNVTDEFELKKGYDVFEFNAKENGYKIRAFNDVKNSILKLINSNRAYFINIYVDGEVKASGFYITAGGYTTNVMSGVIKEKPDLKLGYMLQWEAVKKSFENGHKGYNISMGGSIGVQVFKSKFGAIALPYENPYYHTIIKPLNFKMFKIVDTYLKPYKAQVSKLLSQLK